MANAYKTQWTPDETLANLFTRALDVNGVGYLQLLVDSIDLDENANFYAEHFEIEGSEYDIDISDTKKNPAWTVRQRDIRVVPMADPMAPLSETRQLDSEGYTERTGSIYGYGKGLFETSPSKLEMQAKLAQMAPEDRSLLTSMQKGIRDLIKTHNLRLSNMAAMTLSYGGAYNTTTNQSVLPGETVTTQGMSGVVVSQQPYIPLANFKKAGEKVWTDATCDIPSQMQKIEEDFKSASNLGDDVPFEWDIPYDIVTGILMENEFFKKEVSMYIARYGESNNRIVIVKPDGSTDGAETITYEDLIAYSRSPISKISPIRIVREQQTVQGITTYQKVRGWKPNTVVLRPLGRAGVIVHAVPEWVKLMRSGEVNDSVDWSIAKWNNLIYIINKIVPDGMLKSYHTDAIGRYATVLDESQYHVCVDIATAD